MRPGSRIKCPIFMLIRCFDGVHGGNRSRRCPTSLRRTVMAQITERRDGQQSEASVAELFKQLSDQTSRLVRDEVELAKAELGEKAKSAGLGAGMFGGAGLFGLYALGALT